MNPTSPTTSISSLVKEHSAFIYNLGRRICDSHEEAQDLVQETFLRAYKHWDQFDGRSKPSTWLYKIAVRVCQRMHRRRKGEPEHFYSLSALLPHDEAQIVDLPREQDGPVDEVERQERRELVDHALIALPLHFRLPLVLKDIAEFKISEIARVLDIKEATVKSRVHRGRLMLRNEIAKHLPHKPADEFASDSHVCLSLLQAKQEALDHGAAFPYSEEELCSRCRSVVATLDYAKNACQDLQQGRLPVELKLMLQKEFGKPAS